MRRDDIIEAVSNISDRHIAEAASFKAKKSTPAWVKWGAVAACFCIIAAAGAIIGLGGERGKTPGGDVDVYMESTAAETTTQTKVEAPETSAQTTEDTNAETTAPVETDVTAETTEAPVTTSGGTANMNIDDSSAVTSEPDPWGDKDPPKPDNSPEAQLAKLKERLASSNTEAIRINQQKQALEAEKAELLASVGGDEAKLDSTQSAELKRIDAALEEIWLNYSLLTENPNFYEYEAYFYRTVNNNMAEAKRTMEISEKDSYDYAHAAELVDMFEKMLEMYEGGEDLDTVFLYQFERLAKMN